MISGFTAVWNYVWQFSAKNAARKRVPCSGILGEELFVAHQGSMKRVCICTLAGWQGDAAFEPCMALLGREELCEERQRSGQVGFIQGGNCFVGLSGL